MAPYHPYIEDTEQGRLTVAARETNESQYGLRLSKDFLVTGIATFSGGIGGSLSIPGGIKDSSGTTGNSGQVLSSTGSGLSWINSSDANVGSSNSIAINLNNEDNTQWLVFAGGTSGNQQLRVNNTIRINPGTSSVGIGTLNPTKKLDVVGYGTENGIRVGDTHFFAFSGGDSANKGSPTFQNLNTNSNTILRVLPNGTGRSQFEFFATDYFANGGVGTTTWNNLRIVANNTQGEIRIDTSAAPEAGVAKSISIETNVEPGGGTRPNQYQLYLDVNGNTGMGTSTPLAKFHINSGSAYIPGGTFNASSLGVGNDTKNDAALVIDRDSAIYVQNGGYLRTLIEPAGTILNIGQHNTSHFTEINLKPGNASSNGVKLHHGGTTDNVKLQTTNGGITVTGILTATSFVKASNSGGFLKADGTEDTNTYLTSDSNTTYALSVPSATTKIRLTGSDSSTDDIEIVGTGSVSVTRTNGSKLTISGTDTNTQLSTEAVQDIVGGMVSGNTETNISVTYDDSSGKLNFSATDTNTNTQLSNEDVQDIVGGMVSSNTESGVSVAYQDSDGTLDFTVDATSWPQADGWLPGYSNADNSSITWDFTERAFELLDNSDTSIGAVSKAFRVDTGVSSFNITLPVKCSTSVGSGLYIRVYEYDAELPNGKFGVSNSASNTEIQEDTRKGSISPTIDNDELATSWINKTFTYTPTSTAKWASVVILNWSGMGSNSLFFRPLKISPIYTYLENTGATIGGTGLLITSGGLRLNDGQNLAWGTDQDFQLRYNNSTGDVEGDMSNGMTELVLRDTAGLGAAARFTFVRSSGEFTATGDVTAFSDIKLKTNIEPITGALDKISQINGVTYDRTDIDTGVRYAGVIAQEVEQVLPEVVRTTDDVKTVAYGNMNALLIEAIKELKAEIEELKKKI